MPPFPPTGLCGAPSHADERSAARSPRVFAAILDGPLTRQCEADALGTHGWKPASNLASPAASGAVGAALRFEGIVRRGEPQPNDGGKQRDLLALDYQTYDPMAEHGLLALSRDVAERHGLISLAALHSRGRVAVGEVSFVLIVESAHRAEALAAMADFIDRLKQDVPIWKRQVWEE